MIFLMAFCVCVCDNHAMTSYISRSQLVYIPPQAETFVVTTGHPLKQKEMCSEDLDILLGLGKR